MSKPYVFLCFDTEDPINPESDDALLQLAHLYEDAGLQACFFLVAEKARVLRERGRKDVLDALQRHEIDYHGNYWFEYPELALVYGNEEAWSDAVAKARSYETPGLCDIAEITGRFPVATVQHQSNHSPATTHALQQAGVRAWNGGLGGELEGIGWVMNLLTLGRKGRSINSQGSWGTFQIDPDEPERLPEPMSATEELRNFQQQFDAQLERGHSHINILGHPTCWAISEWWGWYEWPLAFHGENAGRGGPYPHGRRWERGQVRTAVDREAHFQWTADAARWLASRQDIQVATFAEALTAHGEEPGQWLSQAQVRSLAERISARYNETQTFDWVEVESTTLSAADALYVLSQYTESMLRDGRRPAQVQIRRTIGPVETLFRPAETLTFRRSDVLMAARQTAHYIKAYGRVPHAVRAHAVDCGPGELLIALAQLLAADRLADSVSVEPTTGVPECAKQPFFAAPNVGSTHAPPGYKPSQIHLQSLLQSWSYRPAVRIA